MLEMEKTMKSYNAHPAPRLNQATYRLSASHRECIARELEEWEKAGTARAEWTGDAQVWTNSGEEKWLGWLDLVERGMASVPTLRAFASEIQNEGFRHVVLLGMGGSSLGAEVLNATFGQAGRGNGFPHFQILDSTDPTQIMELEKTIVLDRTLFLVASKSGSTLEPNILFEYFSARLAERVGNDLVGSHFVAITDPGSNLEKRAIAAEFRNIFYGDPAVGGRYSVLSNFGLVPAALIGVDIRDFLVRAQLMVKACSKDVPSAENPGVRLGMALACLARDGRDKVTLICPPEIKGIGTWLEQLLAESTGKEGKGLIPICGETVVQSELYGKDRVFVAFRMAGVQSNSDFYSRVELLEAAGHPVIHISISDLEDLGQEFFRWEMAIATFGSILKINPFDQPDVEASKVATRALTSEFESKGRLPDEIPVFEDENFQVFDDEKRIPSITLRPGHAPELSDFLRAHMDRLTPGDYFAILAYLPMNKFDDELLQGLRTKVLRKKQVATCVEFGPRFLHSTGQAYKGGPNSGVFLQITSVDAEDLPVPGHSYTFGVVKAAEARGDFTVLTKRRRRAMRVHFRKNPKESLEAFRGEMERAIV
jgi:transaldolase/glucose-6-phosphate isomerase